MSNGNSKEKEIGNSSNLPIEAPFAEQSGSVQTNLVEPASAALIGGLNTPARSRPLGGAEQGGSVPMETSPFSDIGGLSAPDARKNSGDNRTSKKGDKRVKFLQTQLQQFPLNVNSL